MKQDGMMEDDVLKKLFFQIISNVTEKLPIIKDYQHTEWQGYKIYDAWV